MIIRVIYIALFSIIAFTFNVTAAEVNFGNATISSPEIKAGTDLKKNKATVKSAEVKFNDGSIYIGPLKKNKLHGNGKLILANGKVYEGKFKSNKFTDKVNKKNRTTIKVDLKKGIKVRNQIKVPGLSKWYPADIVGGEFKLSTKGQLMASQDKKASEGGGSSGGSGC